MFILAILEKSQRSEIQIYSMKCDSIINHRKLSRGES